MKLTATDGITLEDGLYPAMLLRIEEREPSTASATQKPYLRWTFSVEADESETELIANSSQAFGPKSKARGWMQAILGREIVAGEEIDVDALVPAPCQVLVKMDADTGFARIEDVVRRKAKSAMRLKKGLCLTFGDEALRRCF